MTQQRFLLLIVLFRVCSSSTVPAAHCLADLHKNRDQLLLGQIEEA